MNARKVAGGAIGPDASGPGDLSHPIQQCHPTAALLGARSHVAGLIPFPLTATLALESFLEGAGNDDKAFAAFPAALTSLPAEGLRKNSPQVRKCWVPERMKFLPQ